MMCIASILIAAILASVARASQNTQSQSMNMFDNGITNRQNLTGLLRLSSLPLIRYFDCLGNSEGNTTYLGYSVENNRLYVNKSATELFGDGDYEGDDCDDDVLDNGLWITDYIIFTSRRYQGIPISESSNDNSFVFSSIPADQGHLMRERDTLLQGQSNMKITFAAQGKNSKLVCDRETVGQCISKRYYTGTITMLTYVDNVKWAAGWSHHTCQYKGTDDYQDQVKVSSRDTNYQVEGEGDRYLYSGAMNYNKMSTSWGTGVTEVYCGDHY